MTSTLTTGTKPLVSIATSASQDIPSTRLNPVALSTIHAHPLGNGIDRAEEVPETRTTTTTTTLQQATFPELRIATLGNVDSGKSSLVAVLSKFVLDDGRGSARAYVFQHAHEKVKGQTSSVALEMMGFAMDGSAVVPNKITGKHVRDIRDLAVRSARSITLIDLCGHEQFLKTTVFGLTGMRPDLVLLVVGANAGVQAMTREHLGLAAALQLPVVVVVTKIDMAPAHIMEDSMRRIDRILKLAGRKKFLVGDETEAKAAAETMAARVVAPVFRVSNTTGEGLPLLRRFLSELVVGAANELAGFGLRAGTGEEEDAKIANLPPPSGPGPATTTHHKTGEGGGGEGEELPPAPAATDAACEYHIDNTYLVQGVGVVVGGSAVAGTLAVGALLLLGPSLTGEFRQVRVASIHRSCVPVDRLFPGQQSTVAIKASGKHAKEVLKRSHLRKGMVLLGEARAEAYAAKNPSGGIACREFLAKIKVLHHTTTIREGYAPIVHLGTVKQACEIVEIEDDVVLRTGSTARVRFRFLYRPEFVRAESIIVFREGTCKGVGTIVKIVA